MTGPLVLQRINRRPVPGRQHHDVGLDGGAPAATHGPAILTSPLNGIGFLTMNFDTGLNPCLRDCRKERATQILTIGMALQKRVSPDRRVAAPRPLKKVIRLIGPGAHVGRGDVQQMAGVGRTVGSPFSHRGLLVEHHDVHRGAGLCCPAHQLSRDHGARKAATDELAVDGLLEKRPSRPSRTGRNRRHTVSCQQRVRGTDLWLTPFAFALSRWVASSWKFRRARPYESQE